jgi:hypothetical protein
MAYGLTRDDALWSGEWIQNVSCWLGGDRDGRGCGNIPFVCARVRAWLRVPVCVGVCPREKIIGAVKVRAKIYQVPVISTRPSRVGTAVTNQTQATTCMACTPFARVAGPMTRTSDQSLGTRLLPRFDLRSMVWLGVTVDHSLRCGPMVWCCQRPDSDVRSMVY